MSFLTSHWLLITAIFVGIYVVALVGEHWLKKRVADKKDGEEIHDGNRTADRH